jgi:hypothetical protein
LLPEIVSARSRYAPATRRKRKNQDSAPTTNNEPVAINDENSFTPETLENLTDPITSTNSITTAAVNSNNQASLTVDNISSQQSILTTTPINKVNQNSIINTKFIKLSAGQSPILFNSNIIRKNQ